MSITEPSSFPKGFIWGAATSAYQIEGAWNIDGRGPSIWDTFSHQPGKIVHGDNGDVATDHYHRWEEDINLMVKLGLKAYRFSISWSRILPQGHGAINKPGLDFYDRLVDALLAHGIEPFPTLYHYDLPQALQDLGGWPTRQTSQLFAEYAQIVARCLGDRVNFWITHNEPMVVAFNGYLSGEHAPGLQDPMATALATHHLLLSHGLAVQAIRSESRKSTHVGIALNFSPVYPASDSEEDRQAVQRIDLVSNRLFLEPILQGKYPDEIMTLVGPLLPQIQTGDLETIATPIDFLGVNYYSRIVFRYDPEIALIQAVQVNPPESEYSQMWEIYPPGLYDLLKRIWQDYHPKNLLITENGVCVPDGIDFDGRIRDERRIRYLQDHLVQVQHALADGIPVSGYLVWSFLDNFEWTYGYRMRFGLVYVDFETLKRTIKDSGRWYADVIKRNGI